MSDNLVSTAAEELKKWLEVLEKLLKKMEADKAAAKQAESSLAKTKLETERFNAMLKELKGIKEGINQLPDDTPGKREAIEEAEKVEQKTKQEMDPDAPGNDLAPGKDVDSPKNDVAQDGVDAEVLEGAGEHVLDDGSGKQSTGESIGWTKGEKGWSNQEGLSIKELGSSIKIGSAGGGPGL